MGVGEPQGEDMTTGDAATFNLSTLIAACADAIVTHADELTALDQAIGDGDHGLNMKRGFEAVWADAGAISAKPLPDALKAVGTKLVMTVGGASGPLYGTLCLTLGKELAADSDRAGLAEALKKAVDSVAARGKSQAGQKTLLDVLYPVQEALAAGKSATEIAGVADAAAQATIPVKATRGRASFLGDRSIGHMDAGARSAAILVRAIADNLGDHA